MYQRNRNLFSFLAVLLTAGLITAMGGLFIHLADQLGGAPRLASDDNNLDSLALDPSATDTSFTDASLSAELVLKRAEREPDTQTRSEATPTAAVPATVAKTVGTHSAAVLSVATTESVIASGSYDNTVKLWSRTDTADVRTLAYEGAVNDLAFSADETLLIAGTDAGNIQLWDMRSEQSAATIPSGDGRINSVAIDSRTSVIASGSSSGSLKIWSLTADYASLENPVVLSNAGAQINSLVFHPLDSNLLITGNQEGVTQVWNIRQGKVALTLKESDEQIVSIDISRDGQYVAAGSYDQKIRVWDITKGELVQTINAHMSVVADVAFGPESVRLASSSYDESIKIWDWANKKLLCSLNGSVGFVYDVAFADEGGMLASGGYDGTVASWDLTMTEACLAE